MFIAKKENGDFVAAVGRQQLIDEVGAPGESKVTVWYQPFAYPCDFFLTQENGVLLESQIPIRSWSGTPFSELKAGKVKFISKRKPKWYKDIEDNKSE